ncbi:beta-lactamase family protein [Chryseobacterium sp. RP-3-3]|uniref:Beta-lactamase family protein n=1 Tax=Chryseobacterium antibioticum TaxID=2728847 RepID=A0A7Y0FSY3_9FLAO|nr:serine hydrolase domain-containing protein [Chryseobacterium antibioticum]NML71161.1 beta-lactamase family protein [Chryseobacterium antibioticum]
MKIKFLFVLVFLAHLCHAQIEGSWNGEIDIQAMKLPIILKIKKSPEGYSSLLNSPKQSKDDITVDQTVFSNNELSFEIKKINASYKGIFKEDHFEGNFSQNGKIISLDLFRHLPASKNSDVPYLNGKAINKEKIDDFLKYIAEKNQGIGSVSIFRNGVQEYHKDFGQQQLTNVTYDKDTQYQIGSISKMITAVMLMQLVENGKLKLDEKLSKYYPEIPNAKKITIKQMLNHTSGLGDYAGEAKDNWLFGKAVGDKAIVAEIKKQGASFEPGKKAKYSNSAYFLLSRILEKISGKPYNIILKENILEKAGMKHTFSVLDDPKNVFKSYKFTDGSWNEVPDFNFRNCVGLGDITSTTEDMNTFIDALFNGKFIKKETLEMMTSNKEEKFFGTGIMKVPFYNIIAYGHGGDTAGSHSMLSYEPTDKLSFAVTVNGENFPHNDLYIGILNQLYGRDYQYLSFDTGKSDPELKKYEGEYESKEIPIPLTVFSKNGALFAQGTGQPEFPLENIEKNKFQFEKGGITILFIPESKQMQLIQNGKTHLFNKK